MLLGVPGAKVNFAFDLLKELLQTKMDTHLKWIFSFCCARISIKIEIKIMY